VNAASAAAAALKANTPFVMAAPEKLAKSLLAQSEPAAGL
jgi:hypothetical protein